MRLTQHDSGAESQLGAALKAALALTEEFGLPVFPCRSRDEGTNGKSHKAKSPLTQNGFKDATLNFDQVGEWWERYPDALIGVPTGAASKLFVIDVDPRGADWYAQNQHRLNAGRVHKTLRGHHLLYRDAGLGCTTGTLADGVDTRGEGGYVIWWPAAGQPAVGDLDDIGNLPDWVLEKLNSKDQSNAPPPSNGGIDADRSKDLMQRVGRDVRGGLADYEIHARHQAHPHAQDQPDADRAVQRCIDKVRAEPAKQSEAARVMIPARAPLDWAALQFQDPPARQWALNQWLPQGHPSLLPGRGGIGKTLLSQCLGTAMALGIDYIDEIDRPLRILFWAGEDDLPELWRRQLKICKHFGVQLSDLKDKLFLQSYAGEDLTLAGMAFGQLQPTLMLEELREQVADYRADYVFMDNVARVYGGSENDRHQTTQFLAWLSAACAPAGVCLLGHPAKGIGSEYSGSTAWEGAVRARLYLSDRLPDAEGKDDDAPPDESCRYLSRRKSNYSPNDWRRFELKDGVLVPEAHKFVAVADIGGEFAKDIVRRAVRKLDSMGFHGNASTRSADYLPKLANQYGLLDRLSEKRFGSIMRDLIKASELTVTEIGRYSNRSPRMGLVLK